MSENAESASEQSVQQVDPNSLPENRPDQQDVIDTLIEELRARDAQVAKVNDERMFFKAQAKKFMRERDAANQKVSELNEQRAGNLE